VGAKLAAALGRRFVDSDAVIEAVAGRSGKDIAAELGVARLHEMEVEALRQALHADHAAVIAAAASAADETGLLEEAVRRGAVVIYLRCDPAILAERVHHGGHRRPISAAEQSGFMETRHRNLEAVAQLIVDTTDASVTDVVAALLTDLGLGGESPTR
jgi:shikimate kinase